jgi:hypothetical protein
MKNLKIIFLYIIILFSIFAVSCNNRVKTVASLEERVFIKATDTFNIYTILTDPLFTAVSFESDSILKQFQKACVTDSILIKEIQNRGHFSHLYYFSQISKEIYTVICGWDYHNSIYLVSEKDKKIIDVILLAIQAGDGGDFFGKSSTYTDNYFISDIEERYSTLTCPFDTTTYYLRGKTKITVDKVGNIHEDTLELKRNFVVVERNLDCELYSPPDVE